MTINETRQKAAKLSAIFGGINLMAAVLAWIGFSQTGKVLLGASAVLFTTLAAFSGFRYATLRRPGGG